MSVLGFISVLCLFSACVGGLVKNFHDFNINLYLTLHTSIRGLSKADLSSNI